jgi:predicted small metal-binding protein
MPKIICSRDIDFDCDFEAWGETEEELFRKVLEHGRTYHGMEYIPIGEGSGFCTSPPLRAESGCDDMGSGNTPASPRQQRSSKTPISPRLSRLFARGWVLFRFSPWRRMNPADIHVMLISMSEGKYIGEGSKWQ